MKVGRYRSPLCWLSHWGYRRTAGGNVPWSDERRLLPVGLLTTIGLSAKNAILIVEFAKDLMDKEGKGLIEATRSGTYASASNPDDLTGVYPRGYAAGH